MVVFGILAMNFLVHCVKIKKEEKNKGSVRVPTSVKLQARYATKP